jgi:hypothetical protein
MSKLETNTIDNISGSSTLNIGDTNATSVTIDSGVSTFTIPNGVATGQNYPAFMVGLSANQTGITAASYTKVTFDEEDVDTDSAFASNKFTVPTGQAGKYFIHLDVQMNAESGAGTATVGSARIYKNGSAAINGGVVDFRNTNGQKFNANVSAIMDLSAGDYLEGYAELHTSSGNVTFVSSNRTTKFFGYRLGA